MDSESDFQGRIAARLRELRNLKRWSLAELAKRTRDRLSKSRISNYEQGTRNIGVYEATILADALGESVSHLLCLDDEMPGLSKLEAQLIGNWRALPENDRLQYAERIAALATAYKRPVPDDRVNQTGFNPTMRPGERRKTR